MRVLILFWSKVSFFILSLWKDSLVVPTAGFKNRIFILPPISVLALFPKGALLTDAVDSYAQRHPGEENQYCVVLSSVVLFCFPRSPGQGINTVKIWASSGNDLLPKGLNSTSVYAFCFRFDGGFTLFREVALSFSIFQFLQRRL